MVMSGRTIARMYRQGTLHSDFGGNGSPEKLVTRPGQFMTIKQSELPDVADYEAFVTLQLAKTRGRQNKMDGRKLRRCVVMHRKGYTMVDCGRALGISTSCVKSWLDILPANLSGSAA